MTVTSLWISVIFSTFSLLSTLQTYSFTGSGFISGGKKTSHYFEFTEMIILQRISSNVLLDNFMVNAVPS